MGGGWGVLGPDSAGAELLLPLGATGVGVVAGRFFAAPPFFLAIAVKVVLYDSDIRVLTGLEERR